MAVFVQELKKLFQPRYVAVALVIFVVSSGFYTVSGFYYTYQMTHQPRPQPNATEAVFYDSYDVLFTDMLLTEYGPAIEKSELPRFREQTERFFAQVREAVKSDTKLQDAHMKLNDDYQIVPDFEFYRESGIEGTQVLMEDPYINTCFFGQIQLPGTDYPLGFAYQMHLLLTGLESASAATSGQEDALYHITSSRFIGEMGYALLPILFASLCSILVIVPYGILENRSRTLPLLCSTRTGRKLELKRLGAALICVLCFVAVGAVLAVVQFTSWDMDAYYATAADDGIYEANGFSLDFHGQIGGFSDESPVVYSGSTFLGLFIQLFIFSVISGIICPMLALLIAFHLRNRVTAFTASLLPALLEFGIFFLDVFRPTGGRGIFSSGRLRFLFPGEPWVVLSALAVILILFVAVHLARSRRCEIK